MSAGLEMDGIVELRAALRELPATLRNETLGPVVSEAAEGMAGDLKSSYAKVTGTLADRVVVEQRGDPLRAKVRTKAPHAHLYEYGTIQRFTKGTGANRGSMPARPTFIPAAIRWRTRMVSAAKSALRALKVPGCEGSVSVRES